MDGEPEVVRLLWSEVRKEYDPWIGLAQCESYALTFLVKHPECLKEIDGGGWQLAGIEVWLKKPGKGEGSRADLIFTREKSGLIDYLVVETEDDVSYKRNVERGKEQAKRYAELLWDHLERNVDKFPVHGRILTAVAAVDHPPTGPKGGLHGGFQCGQEWEETQQ